MAIIMHNWGSNIVRIFIGSGNNHIVELAHSYLFISSLFYFFLAQVFIYRNALQGLGRPVIPMLASAGELFVRAFSAIYLAKIISYYSVFYAGPIAWVTASSVLAIGYYSTINKFIKKAQKQIRG